MNSSNENYDELDPEDIRWAHEDFDGPLFLRTAEGWFHDPDWEKVTDLLVFCEEGWQGSTMQLLDFSVDKPTNVDVNLIGEPYGSIVRYVDYRE